jgi:uncharacterized protein
VHTNLLISLATLTMSAGARLSFLQTVNVADRNCRNASGGIIAAWFGAGYLKRIPKTRMMGVIAGILLATAMLLAAEILFTDAAWSALTYDSAWRGPASVAAGLLVGGEFIIPNLIFKFGADIRTAGTASVLISIPLVLTGVTRHWLTGHYRLQSLLFFLVPPMAVDSGVGAIISGYMAAWAPPDASRLTLAAILAVSAVKLWSISELANSNAFFFQGLCSAGRAISRPWCPQ